MDLEKRCKQCLDRQSKLRQVLTQPAKFSEGRAAFLVQHASLHSCKIEADQEWSFEDAILNDLPESSMRLILKGQEHSIAWCLWHIARIEDVTMNMLLAGDAQVFERDSWEKRLSTTISHTGNLMTAGEIAELSSKIDIEALRMYRAEVGRKTRQIVRSLHAGDMKIKVHPGRIEKVVRAGVVVEGAKEIVDYWSRRDTAGLLLMPATRHNLVHLNEALKIKNKIYR